MKKVLLLTVLLFYPIFSGISADKKIKGNGYITTEQRSVSSFCNIKISGTLNVYLSQGDKESVEVEIDSNLKQYVLVTQNGETLVIDTKNRKDFKATKCNVYITLKDIKKLDISNVGDVLTQTLSKDDKIKLNTSSVGSISLELNCHEIDVKLSGVGPVELHGETSELVLQKSGLGKLKAKELHAKTVKVKNSGLGSMSIYASQELIIANSGLGSITYSGNANITTINSSGLGKISKEE